jgi:nucleotide-binding universal stress UspA family protein
VKVLASLPLREHAEVTVTTVLTLMTYYRMDILQQLSEAWQEETRAVQAELETTAQALRQATPYVTTQLREGANPSQEILTVVRECNAELIVLGRKGKSGIERFLLGSVANRMADYAPCSVWLHQTA